MQRVKINSADMENIWEKRWKARTDLLWLCNEVLSFTKIHPVVHAPVIAHLQKFPVPTREQARYYDRILSNGSFQYTSWCDPYVKLEGPRRRMLLDSRSYMKTTLNTIAHSIQWLLNYPHMAIALMFSTDSKAQDILKNGIKHHFQYNKRLRELFPEYCPQKAISLWGSAESFTLCNRSEILDRLSLPPRVEESMMSQSIGKGQAGYHFDLIKCSDIVEQGNIATPMQRQQIKQGFGLTSKLLVKRPDGRDGFIDLEGTFYHPDDLHNELVNEWIKLAPEKRIWSIFLRGVFKRDVSPAACEAVELDPVGRPKYDPDELSLPFALGSDGKRQPTWPEAEQDLGRGLTAIQKLEMEEASVIDGGFTFATQRTLDFKADKSSTRPFQTPITWVKREDFQRVPIAYHLTTVDFAATDAATSNPSVILTAAFDRSGRAYVHDIQRGWWGPDETLDRLFAVNAQYKPDKIVIEDGLYEKGLRPSIKRLEIEKSTWPPWHFQTRDRTTSKVRKIVAALQTPFNSGELKFIDPLDRADAQRSKEVEAALKNELQDCTMASTGKTDDILDCLADLYLCREWFGAEGIRGGALPEAAAIQRLQQEQFQAAFRKAVFPDDPAFAPPSTRTGW